MDPHLPRGYWPVVTVSKILPSSDGKVRVVEIFREGKYSIRPASRLIVLRELTDDADKTMGWIFCKCKYVNIFGGGCRKFCCDLIGWIRTPVAFLLIKLQSQCVCMWEALSPYRPVWNCCVVDYKATITSTCHHEKCLLLDEFPVFRLTGYAGALWLPLHSLIVYLFFSILVSVLYRVTIFIVLFCFMFLSLWCGGSYLHTLDFWLNWCWLGVFPCVLWISACLGLLLRMGLYRTWLYATPPDTFFL